MNRYDAGDELHRRNAEWLREVDGLDVMTDVAALGELIMYRQRVVAAERPDAR